MDTRCRRLGARSTAAGICTFLHAKKERVADVQDPHGRARLSRPAPVLDDGRRCTVQASSGGRLGLATADRLGLRDEAAWPAHTERTDSTADRRRLAACLASGADDGLPAPAASFGSLMPSSPAQSRLFVTPMSMSSAKASFRYRGIPYRRTLAAQAQVPPNLDRGNRRVLAAQVPAPPAHAPANTRRRGRFPLPPALKTSCYLSPSRSSLPLAVSFPSP
ncbi:hypothetical protein CDD83_937 [Cordyceps sp. RAO-2017]|nr:hypothetical protein CDD83_937 [Cordyceps sp. RAO-2017]